MAHVANHLWELIGQTPIVRLESDLGKTDADVYLKLESFNPGGSVKDRIALSMIEDAEKKRKAEAWRYDFGTDQREYGNRASDGGRSKRLPGFIGDAGYHEYQRRDLLRAYGAELVLTPGAEGMKGAINKAEEVAWNTPVLCSTAI